MKEGGRVGTYRLGKGSEGERERERKVEEKEGRGEGRRGGGREMGKNGKKECDRRKRNIKMV